MTDVNEFITTLQTGAGTVIGWILTISGIIWIVIAIITLFMRMLSQNERNAEMWTGWLKRATIAFLIMIFLNVAISGIFKLFGFDNGIDYTEKGESYITKVEGSGNGNN